MGADAREYDEDFARIEEHVGRITGKARFEVMTALDEDRDGVHALAERLGKNATIQNPAAVSIVAIRSGEHKRRPRVMKQDDGGTGHERTLIPAADALRRLYDAKLDELTRYGLPERERIPIAVDYACGEVWRCQIQPMPDGGIVRLEDDLYRAIGFDRSTGLRFSATS